MDTSCGYPFWISDLWEYIVPQMSNWVTLRHDKFYFNWETRQKLERNIPLYPNIIEKDEDLKEDYILYMRFLFYVITDLQNQ